MLNCDNVRNDYGGPDLPFLIQFWNMWYWLKMESCVYGGVVWWRSNCLHTRTTVVSSVSHVYIYDVRGLGVKLPGIYWRARTTKKWQSGLKFYFFFWTFGFNWTLINFIDIDLKMIIESKECFFLKVQIHID